MSVALTSFEPPTDLSSLDPDWFCGVLIAVDSLLVRSVTWTGGPSSRSLGIILCTAANCLRDLDFGWFVWIHERISLLFSFAFNLFFWMWLWCQGNQKYYNDCASLIRQHLLVECGVRGCFAACYAHLAMSRQIDSWGFLIVVAMPSNESWQERTSQ